MILDELVIWDLDGLVDFQSIYYLFSKVEQFQSTLISSLDNSTSRKVLQSNSVVVYVLPWSGKLRQLWPQYEWKKHFSID